MFSSLESRRRRLQLEAGATADDDLVGGGVVGVANSTGEVFVGVMMGSLVPAASTIVVSIMYGVPPPAGGVASLFILISMYEYV